MLDGSVLSNEVQHIPIVKRRIHEEALRKHVTHAYLLYGLGCGCRGPGPTRGGYDCTLPAGTYTVTRVSEDRFGGLIISSYETRSSVFVIPNEFKGYPANNTKVSFKQIGDVHFLSKIETANGAYNIPVPQSATMVAGLKHGDMSASGTN